jgi:hypothetical protein
MARRTNCDSKIRVELQQTSGPATLRQQMARLSQYPAAAPVDCPEFQLSQFCRRPHQTAIKLSVSSSLLEGGNTFLAFDGCASVNALVHPWRDSRDAWESQL